MKTFALLSQLLLLFLGLFLMIVVLLQRGRGGGLAGAFGGLGGQSAFGTKAGDVFTKITVVIAIAWVAVAGGSGYLLRAGATTQSKGLDVPGMNSDEESAEEKGEAGSNPFDSAIDTDDAKSPVKGTEKTPPPVESSSEAAAPQAPKSDNSKTSEPTSGDATESESTDTDDAAPPSENAKAESKE